MKRTQFFTIFGMIAYLAFPVSSFADDCGNDDRERPPRCFGTNQGNDWNKWEFHNDCPGPITIKFDKPGPDKRWTIPADTTGYWDGGDRGTNWQVHCCPRYNRCDYEKSVYGSVNKSITLK